VAKLGVANAYGIVQHRVENRIEIAGRAGDDSQHLRGRGLLLQRFGEIVGALSQFAEQPRVLDGDDGLRGEIMEQLDLLFSERLYLLAIDRDDADQLFVLDHWHCDERAGAAKLDDADDGGLAFEISLFGREIDDVLDLLGGNRTRQRYVRRGTQHGILRPRL